MEIKNREKFLAILVGICVLVWLGDTLLVSPLVASWKSRTARIADLKKSIENGSLLISRQETIEGRWDQIKTNTFPNTESLADGVMLKAFYRWAQDSGITVASVKPQWKETDDDYTSLECRADATGNMETIKHFLYEMEKDPLALKVESVEITSRDDTGQQLSLVVQLSGLVLNSTTEQ
jgi:hypothetical protein